MPIMSNGALHHKDHKVDIVHTKGPKTREENHSRSPGKLFKLVLLPITICTMCHTLVYHN